jgi:hypothetical protein
MTPRGIFNFIVMLSCFHHAAVDLQRGYLWVFAIDAAFAVWCATDFVIEMVKSRK